MSVKILGIKNCDKVRAAKKWLDAAEIDYTFQDIREQAVKRQQWISWLKHFGWEKLINKRSTTWKTLDKKLTASVNEKIACQLLETHPTLMKRPLLIINEQPEALGFKNSIYENLF